MQALADVFAGRTVALYGGSGLIGRGLVRQLAALAPAAIHVISRHSPRDMPAPVRAISASVLDEAALGQLPEADLAVYIAGTASNYAAEPEATIELATRGLSSFLRGTTRARRRVVISSARIYGPRDVAVELDESAVCTLASPHPRNIYDASKLLSEALASAASTEASPVTIARLTNLYGGTATTSGTAFHDFVAQAARSRRIQLRGAPGSLRNHVHIDDACEGVLRVLAYGAPGAAYNIGSDEHLTTHELATRIAAALPFDVTLEMLAPAAAPDHMVISIAKARRELAYAPSRHVQTSLQPLVLQALEESR